MAPKSYADKILPLLTLEEKISLLTGQNFWETASIPRLKVPSLKFTDGPNGARGSNFKGGLSAACFPACVSLAATWDHSLVHRVGTALAEEAKTKDASVLLGPTVCPHRSPLGGRNFESFSEDPFLSGKLASTYIKALQEQGIGATVKHFAANEQETRRYTMNVNVSERALRELYLKPFEIAIKEAAPWVVMTSYNLVNGVHADMSTHLLQTVLREQWGWDGVVISDWGGTNSVAESVTAGLSLEMPGPAFRRKLGAVQSAVDNGSLQVEAVDLRVKEVLTILEKAGKVENPDSVAEKSIDSPEHRQLIREAGAHGIVLLKNDSNILPLAKDKLKSIAALGLAKECLAHGGGSASVPCHYKISPWQALEMALDGKVELKYSAGATMFRTLPELKDRLFDVDGQPGMTLSRYSSTDFGSKPYAVESNPSATYRPMTDRCTAFTLAGTFKPTITGSHYLSFSGLGPSKFFIDGRLVLETLENSEDPMAFLIGVVDEEATQYSFVAGQIYSIHIESLAPVSNGGEYQSLVLLDGLPGTRVGFMLQSAYEADLLPSAVEAATGADVALVFVGNTALWETEGQDRSTMALPKNGSQDALIDGLCAVNSNVIVINSTGGAISMPWLSKVSAVLQVWFGGQESGNSIVDILFGDINPSGKLPVSFARRLEDTPSFGNFPGDIETLQVSYEEGIYVGYRHYDRCPEKILFPFGFGLSYTTFEISDVVLSSIVLNRASNLRLKVNVRNTGQITGSEVIQVYTSGPTISSIDMPTKQLAGYTKVLLAPGEMNSLSIDIDCKILSYWSETEKVWVVQRGDYQILVGNSSRDISTKISVSVEETFSYNP